MSERYDKCKLCKGKGSLRFRLPDGTIESRECGMCEGTGWDGSVEAFLKKDQAEDDEKFSRHIQDFRKRDIL